MAISEKKKNTRPSKPPAEDKQSIVLDPSPIEGLQISAEDLMENIGDNAEEAELSIQGIPVSLGKREHRSAMMQLEAKEYSDVIGMRKGWSQLLMVMVFLIVMFQGFLFVAVGLGWLVFKDAWLARILFPGTFLEILGFVYIVINYLFPTRSKKK